MSAPPGCPAGSHAAVPPASLTRSFCGKLTSVKKNGTEADITFEKQSAMRTALMLNGGTVSVDWLARPLCQDWLAPPEQTFAGGLYVLAVTDGNTSLTAA